MDKLSRHYLTKALMIIELILSCIDDDGYAEIDTSRAELERLSEGIHKYLETKDDG